MFTQITHEFVGTERMFMPQGYSPYAVTDETLAAENAADPGTTVLVNGDAVTVEAAFENPSPGTKNPVLFYVRSHRTGLASHVLIDDIKLALPLRAPLRRELNAERDGFGRAIDEGRTPTIEDLDDPMEFAQKTIDRIMGSGK